MTEVLKFYEYGDPSLLQNFDYDTYLLVLLETGESLRQFWQMNVKRYFNRTKINYFSKGGELKLQAPKRTSGRSVLSSALGTPDIDVGAKVGVLPLLNVVKQNDNGSSVELVKLLMSGASPQTGMHFDGSGMRPGGTWKGFPASYWLRWDGVFMEQCKSETSGMQSKMLQLADRNEFNLEEGEYLSKADLIDAYRRGSVKIGGKLV